MFYDQHDIMKYHMYLNLTDTKAVHVFSILFVKKNLT